jgi:hypothetical protein
MDTPSRSVPCEAFLAVAIALEDAATKQKFISTVKVALARKMNTDHIMELFLGSLFVDGSEETNPKATAFLQVVTLLEEAKTCAKFKGIITTAVLKNRSADQLIELLRAAMFIEGSTDRDEERTSIATITSVRTAVSPVTTYSHHSTEDDMMKKRVHSSDNTDGEVRGKYAKVSNERKNDDTTLKCGREPGLLEHEPVQLGSSTVYKDCDRASQDCGLVKKMKTNASKDQASAESVSTPSVPAPLKPAGIGSGGKNRSIVHLHQRCACPVHHFQVCADGDAQLVSLCQNQLYCGTCCCSVCYVAASECSQWKTHCFIQRTDSEFELAGVLRDVPVCKPISGQSLMLLLSRNVINPIILPNDELRKLDPMPSVEGLQLRMHIERRMRYLKSVFAARFKVAVPDVDGTAWEPSCLSTAHVESDIVASVGEKTTSCETQAACAEASILETLQSYDDFVPQEFDEDYDFELRHEHFERSGSGVSNVDRDTKTEITNAMVPADTQASPQAVGMWGTLCQEGDYAACGVEYSDDPTYSSSLLDPNEEAKFIRDAMVETLIFCVVVIKRLPLSGTISKESRLMAGVASSVVELMLLPFCTLEMKAFVTQQLEKLAPIHEFTGIISDFDVWKHNAERNAGNRNNLKSLFQVPPRLSEASLPARILFDSAATSLGLQSRPKIGWLDAYGDGSSLRLAIKMCALDHSSANFLLPVVVRLFESSLTKPEAWIDADNLATLLHSTFSEYIALLALLVAIQRSPGKAATAARFASVMLVRSALRRFRQHPVRLDSDLYTLGRRFLDDSIVPWDKCLGLPNLRESPKLLPCLLLVTWRLLDYIVDADCPTFVRTLLQCEWSNDTGVKAVIQYIGAFNDINRDRDYRGCDKLPILLAYKMYPLECTTLSHHDFRYLCFDSFLQGVDSSLVYLDMKAVDLNLLFGRGRPGTEQILASGHFSMSELGPWYSKTAFGWLPLLQRQFVMPDEWFSIATAVGLISRHFAEDVAAAVNVQTILSRVKAVSCCFLLSLMQGRQFVRVVADAIKKMAAYVFAIGSTVAAEVRKSPIFVFNQLLYKVIVCIDGSTACFVHPSEHNPVLRRFPERTVLGLVCYIRDCLQDYAIKFQPSCKVMFLNSSHDKTVAISSLLRWSFWQAMLTRIYGSVDGPLNNFHEIATHLLLLPGWNPTYTALEAFPTVAVEQFFKDMRSLCELALDMAARRLLRHVIYIAHVYANHPSCSITMKVAYLHCLQHTNKSVFVKAMIEYGHGAEGAKYPCPVGKTKLGHVKQRDEYVRTIAISLLSPELIAAVIEFHTKPGIGSAGNSSSASRVNSNCWFVQEGRVAAESILRSYLRQPRNAIRPGNHGKLDIMMASAVSCAPVLDIDPALIFNVLFGTDIMDFRLTTPSFEQIMLTDEQVDTVHTFSDVNLMISVKGFILRCLQATTTLSQANRALNYLNMFVAESLIDSSDERFSVEVQTILDCLLQPEYGISMTSASVRQLQQPFPNVIECCIFISDRMTRKLLLEQLNPNYWSNEQHARVLQWRHSASASHCIHWLDAFDAVLRCKEDYVVETLLDKRTKWSIVPEQRCSSDIIPHFDASTGLYWDDGQDVMPILSQQVAIFFRLLSLVLDNSIDVRIRAVFFSWLISETAMYGHDGPLKFDVTQVARYSHLKELHPKLLADRKYIESAINKLEAAMQDLETAFEGSPAKEKLPTTTEAMNILRMHVFPTSLAHSLQALSGSGSSNWIKNNYVAIGQSLLGAHHNILHVFVAYIAVGDCITAFALMNNRRNPTGAMRACIQMLQDSSCGLANQILASSSVYESDEDNCTESNVVCWPNFNFLQWLVELNKKCHNINTDSDDTIHYALTEAERGSYESMQPQKAAASIHGRSFGTPIRYQNSNQTRSHRIGKVALEEHGKHEDYLEESCEHGWNLQPLVRNEWAKNLFSKFSVLIELIVSGIARASVNLDRVGEVVAAVRLAALWDVDSARKLIRCGRPGLTVILKVFELYLGSKDKHVVSNSIDYNVVLFYRMITIQQMVEAVDRAVSRRLKLLCTSLCEVIFDDRTTMRLFARSEVRVYRVVDNPCGLDPGLLYDVNLNIDMNLHAHFRALNWALEKQSLVGGYLQSYIVLMVAHLLNHLTSWNPPTDWIKHDLIGPLLTHCPSESVRCLCNVGTLDVSGLRLHLNQLYAPYYAASTSTTCPRTVDCGFQVLDSWCQIFVHLAAAQLRFSEKPQFTEQLMMMIMECGNLETQEHVRAAVSLGQFHSYPVLGPASGYQVQQLPVIPAENIAASRTDIEPGEEEEDSLAFTDVIDFGDGPKEYGETKEPTESILLTFSSKQTRNLIELLKASEWSARLEAFVSSKPFLAYLCGRPEHLDFFLSTDIMPANTIFQLAFHGCSRQYNEFLDSLSKWDALKLIADIREANIAGELLTRSTSLLFESKLLGSLVGRYIVLLSTKRQGVDDLIASSLDGLIEHCKRISFSTPVADQFVRCLKSLHIILRSTGVAKHELMLQSFLQQSRVALKNRAKAMTAIKCFENKDQWPDMTSLESKKRESES